MTFQLLRLVPPVLSGPDAHPTGRPARALTEGGELVDAEWRRFLGIGDMDTAPEVRLPAFANQRYATKIQVVAVEGLGADAIGNAMGGGGALGGGGATGGSGAGSAADAALAHLPTLSAVEPGSSSDPAEEPATDLELLPDGARVVGWLGVHLPRHDNTHLADVYVAVAEDRRRRGIGTALLDLAERVARAEGRRSWSGWTTHAVVDEKSGRGADVLVPVTGVGAIPRDEVSTYLAERGWTLQQCERMSLLEVPALSSIETLLDAAALATGPGYRVHTFEGECPEQWREGYAELRRRMSVDVPSGELDIEEQVWDAERIAQIGRSAARAGILMLTTVAEELGTGRLVAYTEIAVEGAATPEVGGAPAGDVPADEAPAHEAPTHEPVSGTQEDTFVHGEHRGHRLGLLVKLINLRELRERRPSVDRLYTWNAGENAHMLAINEVLGFRLVAMEGAWDKRATT